MTEAPAPRRAKQLGLHMLRVLLFASVLFFIHRAQAALEIARALEPKAPVELEELIEFFPQAASLSEADSRGRREVFDSAGEAKEAGFSQVSIERYPWVRKISPKGFEQIAQSSTRYQAARKANPEATEAALNALLSASGDADGQITVEYETKIIAAAL